MGPEAGRYSSLSSLPTESSLRNAWRTAVPALERSSISSSYP